MKFEKKNYYAPAPTTARGQPVRLSVDPDGKRFVYASGKTIVVRSLENLEQAWEYRGHTQATTCARFSSSGAYVASGDVQGNVRIWTSHVDEDTGEHRLKSEFRPMNGRINDLAWDHESQRIMAVGDGKGKLGHFFLFDTGNTVGTVEGHSRSINACSMRQQRPFRAVSCSDEGRCVFYTGAPYRFSRSLSDHTGFIHDVRYAPNDEHFASVGADRHIYLYEGRTGDLVRQLAADRPEDAHTGSIFAVSWSPDSKHLLTSAADGTCRIWDVAADRLVHTITIGEGVDHHQVGNLWQGNYILSLSLNGDLNVLSMDSDKPVMQVVGHQRAITTGVMAGKLLYTGSYDGKLCCWDFASATPGVPTEARGDTGGTRLDAADAAGNQVALGYLNDTLRIAQDASIDNSAVTALPAGPLSVALTPIGTLTLAALANGSLVAIAHSSGRTRQLLPGTSDEEACTVAIDKITGTVAVGFKNTKVRLYKLNNIDDIDKAELVSIGDEITGHRREITFMAFSPLGTHLASGDSAGKIIVSDAATGALITSNWGSHTARIYSIAWSPSGLFAASASLDSHIIYWSIEKPLRNVQNRNAHIGGATSVSFIDEDTLVSAGNDGGVKVWSLVE
ncbi:WD40 repeat-like protein [Coemansia sp. Benny D115]|nr:WD40 repeat-like protein [Coemansia sp. Benny D115]